MGNVPPTPASRSQSLPVTRPASETSSMRRYGRQSLPGTNILQNTKRRIRNNLEQVRQSTPSLRSISTANDEFSQQSTPSVTNSDTCYFHPNYKSISSDQLANSVAQQNRPFHNFGNAKYSLPCDEEEQDRMMTLVRKPFVLRTGQVWISLKSSLTLSFFPFIALSSQTYVQWKLFSTS